MQQQMNISFPVATYEIKAILDKDYALPDYAGSMLRGVYGHALRELSCMTGEKRCDNCSLINTCPYPKLFDPAMRKEHRGRDVKSPPTPYVIQAPGWGRRALKKGELLVFNIRLFGRESMKRVPFVIEAWRQALINGLDYGHKKTIARICQVNCLETGQKIFDGNQSYINIGNKVSFKITQETTYRTIKIAFNTPYRSQEKGHPISAEKITPRRLIADVVRRVRLLNDFYGDGAGDDDWDIDSWLEAADKIKHDKKLYWQDWCRYSGRQRKFIPLGGIMGEWRFFDCPPELINILRIGELTHIGKQTVFGFGNISCSTE